MKSWQGDRTRHETRPTRGTVIISQANLPSRRGNSLNPVKPSTAYPATRLVGQTVYDHNIRKKMERGRGRQTLARFGIAQRWTPASAGLKPRRDWRRALYHGVIAGFLGYSCVAIRNAGGDRRLIPFMVADKPF